MKRLVLIVALAACSGCAMVINATADVLPFTAQGGEPFGGGDELNPVTPAPGQCPAGDMVQNIPTPLGVSTFGSFVGSLSYCFDPTLLDESQSVANGIFSMLFVSGDTVFIPTGDTLSANFLATLSPGMGVGLGSEEDLTGTFSITGGSGQFLNATGSGTLDGGVGELCVALNCIAPYAFLDLSGKVYTPTPTPEPRLAWAMGLISLAAVLAARFRMRRSAGVGSRSGT